MGVDPSRRLTVHPAQEPRPDPHPDRDGPLLRIDCDECILQATDACADCVITFLCGEDAANPVVVDLAEARAMRLLDDVGLVPPLRHSRRTG
jgi:hypothetical protein